MATILMFFPTIAGLAFLRWTGNEVRSVLKNFGRKRYLLHGAMIPVAFMLIVIGIAISAGIMGQGLTDAGTGMVILPDGETVPLPAER